MGGFITNSTHLHRTGAADQMLENVKAYNKERAAINAENDMTAAYVNLGMTAAVKLGTAFGQLTINSHAKSVKSDAQTEAWNNSKEGIMKELGVDSWDKAKLDKAIQDRQEAIDNGTFKSIQDVADKYDQQIKESETTLNNIETNIQKVDSDLQKVNDSISLVKGNLQNTEAKLKVKEAELKVKEAEFANNPELQSEIDLLKQRQEELKDTLNEFEQDKSKLEIDKANLEKDKATVKEELEALPEEKNNAIQKAKIAENTKLNDMKEQIKKLNNETDTETKTSNLSKYKSTADNVATLLNKEGVTADELEQAKKDLDEAWDNLPMRMKFGENKKQMKAKMQELDNKLAQLKYNNAVENASEEDTQSVLSSNKGLSDAFDKASKVKAGDSNGAMSAEIQLNIEYNKLSDSDKIKITKKYEQVRSNLNKIKNDVVKNKMTNPLNPVAPKNIENAEKSNEIDFSNLFMSSKEAELEDLYNKFDDLLFEAIESGDYSKIQEAESLIEKFDGGIYCDNRNGGETYDLNMQLKNAKESFAMSQANR